jgi:hypothetical protein
MEKDNEHCLKTISFPLTLHKEVNRDSANLRRETGININPKIHEQETFCWPSG